MQPQPIEHSLTPASVGEPRIAAVPPDQLSDVFPHVRDMLESVVDRSEGRYSLQAILKRLLAKEWILWVIGDGSTVRGLVITELYLDVSGMRCCMVRVATGSGAKELMPLLGVIEDWARADGCVKLDMMARKGWARHLKDYRMTHVVLEKTL